MLDYLNKLDTALFLFLNGNHNALFDVLMYWASDRFIWIPLYVFIIYLLIKQYGKSGIYITLTLIALIVLSDQISSHLIKNTLVMRLRPSHEPTLEGLVHLSKAGKGGLYGFVSSHAANTFALATFLFYFFSPSLRWLNYTILAWATMVSYSRIYNGVHYPADILAAIPLGVLLGCLVANLYLKLSSMYKHKLIK